MQNDNISLVLTLLEPMNNHFNVIRLLVLDQIKVKYGYWLKTYPFYNWISY